MKNNQSELLLVVPAFNEEDNIVSVINDLTCNYPQYDYVIINDGSTDRTRQICLDNSFHMIDYPVNLGLGAAFYGGLLYGVRKDYRYIMQYDGDGQHDARYIRDMIDVAAHVDADVVIGSRYIDGDKPWNFRMIGSRLIGLCIKLTTGVSIKDPTSGMRLFGRRAMSTLLRFPSMEPEPDTLVYLLKNGMRVRECRVDMRDRVAGSSYLNPIGSLKYMWRICFSILVVSHFRKKVS